MATMLWKALLLILVVNVAAEQSRSTKCLDVRLDVIVLIQADVWISIQEDFLEDVLDNFDVDSARVRIAIMYYSYSGSILYGFDYLHNMTDINNVLRRSYAPLRVLPSFNKHVSQETFERAMRFRGNGVKPVIVLLGMSEKTTVGYSYISRAQLHSQQVSVYFIFLGSSYNPYSMSQVVQKDGGIVYDVKYYISWKFIIADFLPELCIPEARKSNRTSKKCSGVRYILLLPQERYLGRLFPDHTKSIFDHFDIAGGTGKLPFIFYGNDNDYDPRCIICWLDLKLLNSTTDVMNAIENTNLFTDRHCRSGGGASNALNETARYSENEVKPVVLLAGFRDTQLNTGLHIAYRGMYPHPISVCIIYHELYFTVRLHSFVYSMFGAILDMDRPKVTDSMLSEAIYDICDYDPIRPFTFYTLLTENRFGTYSPKCPCIDCCRLTFRQDECFEARYDILIIITSATFYLYKWDEMVKMFLEHFDIDSGKVKVALIYYIYGHGDTEYISWYDLNYFKTKSDIFKALYQAHPPEIVEHGPYGEYRAFLEHRVGLRKHGATPVAVAFGKERHPRSSNFFSIFRMPVYMVRLSYWETHRVSRYHLHDDPIFDEHKDYTLSGMVSELCSPFRWPTTTIPVTMPTTSVTQGHRGTVRLNTITATPATVSTTSEVETIRLRTTATTTTTTMTNQFETTRPSTTPTPATTQTSGKLDTIGPNTTLVQVIGPTTHLPDESSLTTYQSVGIGLGVAIILMIGVGAMAVLAVKRRRKIAAEMSSTSPVCYKSLKEKSVDV